MAEALTEGVALPEIPRVDPRASAELALLRETTMSVVIDEVCYIDRADHRRALLMNLDALADDYAEALTRFDDEA